jgi:hypothetical protein
MRSPDFVRQLAGAQVRPRVVPNAVAASLLSKKVMVRPSTRAQLKRKITRARQREEEAQAEQEKLEATRHAELLAAIKSAHPKEMKKKTSSAKPNRRMSATR